MTATEVLNEIDKMTLSEKRALLEQLSLELEAAEPTTPEISDAQFAANLRERGLIVSVPNRKRDTEDRKNFKRISIKGEPLSETIVKERR